MAKTIVLENAVVKRIDIDYSNQCVLVTYELQDSNGKPYETGVAIFWVTMPPQPVAPGGGLLPYPEEWFTLPLGYIQILLDLRNDADTAITNRFL